jgi:glycosyltransferase involved in cell wall biosynthesis
VGVRIGLLTEGGYPYVSGEARLWCDRLVRGLEQHEFDIYALSRSQEQEDAGWIELPPQVSRVRTAPLWTGADDTAHGPALGRRARRRFAPLYGELVTAIVRSGGADASAGVESAVEADRFATALYGLAALARDEGSLGPALRSEAAVRTLERACRAPGAPRAVRAARVPDLLAFAGHLERALRPLSLDWYDDQSGFPGEAGGLGAVDLCHAASGGSAALPGLVAKHFFGVPLLVTEYGVQLRARYLAAGDAELSAPVRALLAAFHGRLAAEVYREAAVITPGNAHARRWQERCGAERDRLRTVHPGMDATRFAEVGEREEPGDPGTLVWVGRIEPSKDLINLLHAFAEIRKEEPGARLRIVGAVPPGSAPGAAGAGAGTRGGAGAGVGTAGRAGAGARAEAASDGGIADAVATGLAPDGGQPGASADEAETYLGHCKALAAQLFPDEAEGLHSVGENPVSFEELGSPEAPDLADAYGAGSVVVLSSVVEGFPISLAEAMFCGRATVSTDVGAVVEVIGGTGLVVPPRNPKALAEACIALLRDPERCERLGAAARARALELFTVEQNIAAFHGIYLEIVSRCPVRREALDDAGDPLPFAHPPEAHVPGRWTAPPPTGTPAWATPGGARDPHEQLAGVTPGCGEAEA